MHTPIIGVILPEQIITGRVINIDNSWLKSNAWPASHVTSTIG